MNVNRILSICNEEDATGGRETQSDGEIYAVETQPNTALNKLKHFLTAWWEQMEIDAMFVPVEQPDQTGISLRVIKDPRELEIVNPFAPIMLINSAAAVESFIKDHPGKRLAAILRPCELRALVELQKRHKVNPHSQAGDEPLPGAGENVTQEGRGGRLDSTTIQPCTVIIGVDCPGTFSVNEYARRVVAQGVDGLTREVLTYSVESGPVPGRGPGQWPGQFRSACQLCDRPAPLGADIVIGTVGVVLRGYLLVIASDEEADLSLKLSTTTDGLATEEQVIQREFAVGAVMNQRADRRKNLAREDSLDEKNFSSLLGLFARCTLCADCLDACPLYGGELAGMLGVNRLHQAGRPLLSELVGVSRWLVSCSGCGMCQEACEHSVTLSQLISAVSHRLRSELHYTAGDPLQRLPWEGA